MKIWAKAVRIFNFRAHDVNERLRHIVVPYNIIRFRKENHPVDQGEETGTIISTKTDIQCHFTIIVLYGYVFICSLFRYYLYLYPVNR